MDSNPHPEILPELLQSSKNSDTGKVVDELTLPLEIPLLTTGNGTEHVEPVEPVGTEVTELSVGSMEEEMPKRRRIDRKNMTKEELEADWKRRRAEAQRRYRSKRSSIERRRERDKRDDVKDRVRQYRSRPDVKERIRDYRREYKKRDYVRDKRREEKRRYRERKKQEKLANEGVAAVAAKAVAFAAVQEKNMKEDEGLGVHHHHVDAGIDVTGVQLGSVDDDKNDLAFLDPSIQGK